MLPPINLKKWIDENQDSLKPPVNNKLIYKDSEYIVMVVGGPNDRHDYHINQGEELFYQIKGNMVLKVIENDQPKDIQINEGDMFLLPAAMPHSPQRPAESIGLVIEKQRQSDELDSFLWVCQQCGNKLYQEELNVSDIVTQLPEVFKRFSQDPNHTTCDQCGSIFQL